MAANNPVNWTAEHPPLGFLKLPRAASGYFHRYTYMEPMFERRECDRCGESITTFGPSLRTLSHINKITNQGNDALVAEIARLERVPVDLVLEFMRHRMYAECPIVHANCAFCGSALATRKAKQCLNCHRSWHANTNDADK